MRVYNLKHSVSTSFGYVLANNRVMITQYMQPFDTLSNAKSYMHICRTVLGVSVLRPKDERIILRHIGGVSMSRHIKEYVIVPLDFVRLAIAYRESGYANLGPQEFLMKAWRDAGGS